MIVGECLRMLREQKNLSQGDIEKRTGLLRCYVSRVENGHTVPAVETLEKMARALELPLYQLMYDSDEPPKETHETEHNEWGARGKDERFLRKMCRCLSRMKQRDRELLLGFAENVARK
jgi:transcriptional regulator with XRE-family HTH domain